MIAGGYNHVCALPECLWPLTASPRCSPLVLTAPFCSLFAFPCSLTALSPLPYISLGAPSALPRRSLVCPIKGLAPAHDVKRERMVYIPRMYTEYIIPDLGATGH